jgi:uracil-DNA glycosylase
VKIVTYEKLIEKVRTCRLCAGNLILESRPIIRRNLSATILIIGQAPGMRVHVSGVPWDGKPEERLRAWLSLSINIFF